MDTHIAEYLSWLTAAHYSPATVRNRRTGLTRFGEWACRRGLVEPSRISLAVLEEYRVALYGSRARGGRTLGRGTQADYLGAVKAFFTWCAARGTLTANPAAAFPLPRRPFQLPKAILNPYEVERVLRQPERGTPAGLRDRALLEMMYSTGLRRSEVANLAVEDIDLWRGVVMVRGGKGQRDRVVPLGRRAQRWVVRYLRRARPVLGRTSASRTLFLSARGGTLKLNRLSERVHRYISAAGLGKEGSCHLFRHTMATLLLEGGADVRDVQEILGHSNLSTTARYTHISIARLQAVHARAHPAERKERGRRAR